MRKSTVKKTSVKKEVLEKKPIVKIPVKKVKKISKIVKPLFIEEPIIEINYSWDI